MAESKQKILEKAIQKAIDGGWQGFWGKSKKLDSVTSTQDAISGMPTVTISIRHNSRIFGYGGIPIFNIIYNHDFAKALWGEEESYSDDTNQWLPKWKTRTQDMVIAEDPIKYLGENI
jgi:hypothetical protein